MPSTAVSPDVGVSSVPAQVLKKAVQRGLVFNLLVIAEKGTGAKTLVSSIYNLEQFPPVKEKHSEHLTEHCCRLKADSVSVTLNIFVYRGRLAEEVTELVLAKNRRYNEQNVGIKRERVDDPRIHAALYLISPLSFPPEDLQLLRALAELTNTVPVVTKRDIFTAHELASYRELIRAQIDQERIVLCQVASLGLSYPLSTVASCSLIAAGDRSVRGREYRWGTINAEDPEVSDLPTLVALLLTQSFVCLKRQAVQYYNRWKDQANAEQSRRPLSSQETELVKEIEHTITQRLRGRREALEQEEKLLDRAVQSLAPPPLQPLPPVQQPPPLQQ